MTLSDKIQPNRYDGFSIKPEDVRESVKKINGGIDALQIRYGHRSIDSLFKMFRDLIKEEMGEKLI